MDDGHVNASTQSPASLAYMKARQCARIAELRTALVNAGFVSLDAKAIALGLSRTTTWAVLKGNHKASGLSAALISRILLSPQLPASARVILVQYVEEKLAGAYGHSHRRLQIFRKQLLQLSQVATPAENKEEHHLADIRPERSDHARPAARLSSAASAASPGHVR